jgi:hypothetical protein
MTSRIPSQHPLVEVREPDAEHIDVILRPGADAATLAALPADAFYLDGETDPAHTRLTLHRTPRTATPATSTAPGWTPRLPTGPRRQVRAADDAMRAVIARLVLGEYDADILRPPSDGSRPTVLTIVGLVRTRADMLARPPRHR